MKTIIHAIAGLVGILCIVTFWSSTAVSELFGTYDDIAGVKDMVLRGMFVLIPAMVIAGASGMSLGKKRKDPFSKAKKKRMPIIALNGLLVLLPSAFFLASKANSGQFDNVFYIVQVIELIAGALNFTLMGLNMRDGLRMTGRIARSK